jgi:hypothetical protein
MAAGMAAAVATAAAVGVGCLGGLIEERRRRKAKGKNAKMQKAKGKREKGPSEKNGC